MVNPSLSSSSVVKVKLGTWQLTKGSHWDDGGGYTGIRSITVVHSVLGVSMIQLEYDLFGKPVPGEEYRGSLWPFRAEATTKEKVILDFPSEFLIAVSCDFQNHRYEETLGILQFKTNKRMIGPFGPSLRWQRNPWLQCSVDGGMGAIVGFFGMFDRRLESIGCYIAVLCPTADFFDKMQEQGLMPYRTSPLSTPSPSSAM